MTSFDIYLSEIKKKIPDVENMLNPPASEEEISAVGKAAGYDVPEEYKALYRRANGENEDGALGLFTFYFFSAKRAADDIKMLKGFSGFDFDAMKPVGTDKIKSVPYDKLKVLPFADDGSRCMLAVDLDPAPTGKVGQVILADHDTEKLYLIADSLDDMYIKMTEWIKDGTLIVKRIMKVIDVRGFEHLGDYLEQFYGES